MVVIRLTRGGSHKKPFYHIVATDSRFKRDGRFIERLGFYNPIENAAGIENRLKIDTERVNYWVGKGAKMSDTVTRLVKQFSKNTVGNNGLSDESSKEKVAAES